MAPDDLVRCARRSDRCYRQPPKPAQPVTKTLRMPTLPRRAASGLAFLGGKLRRERPDPCPLYQKACRFSGCVM
jgi:hypothetical protein